MGRKAWLFLVEIHGHDVKINRCGFLQAQQNVEHGVRIFAAREANHDFVAVFYHAKIIDGIAHRMAQAFHQFVGFEFGFAFFRHNGNRLNRKGCDYTRKPRILGGFVG